MGVLLIRSQIINEKLWKIVKSNQKSKQLLFLERLSHLSLLYQVKRLLCAHTSDVQTFEYIDMCVSAHQSVWFGQSVM